MNHSAAAQAFPVRENVTEGAMRIIESVVRSEKNHDRNFLLGKVCDELEARYVGDSLEYHLGQMNISTTSDILHAIDLFFVFEMMFPETSFLKSETA